MSQILDLRHQWVVVAEDFAREPTFHAFARLTGAKIAVESRETGGWACGNTYAYDDLPAHALPFDVWAALQPPEGY